MTFTLNLPYICKTVWRSVRQAAYNILVRAGAIVSFACAAGGLAQTAPEGLVPLDSRSSPAGGTGVWICSFICAASSRQKDSGTKGAAAARIFAYGEQWFILPVGGLWRNQDDGTI